jgi:hypothetical protein
VDVLGLNTVTLTLTRNAQGWFAIYGDLNVSVDDADTAKCCGFPLYFKTLESPGVDLKSRGTYVPAFIDEDKRSDGKTSINAKYNLGLSKGYWNSSDSSLPARPNGMSEKTYNDVINKELHTSGESGLNIHFGPNTNHSTGCVLIGTTYISVPQVLSPDRSDRFAASLERGVVYFVPGFPVQDTIDSQFKLFAAIDCATKRGSRLRYVVGNNTPARDPKLSTPIPYTPDPRGRRAVPINDDFAFTTP